MPLYRTPGPDFIAIARTSTALKPLVAPIRMDSRLPSDVTLSSRGVKFDNFEPFPIIKAGELWNTRRGEIVIVKTKVSTRDGVVEKEVPVADTGTKKVVLDTVETEADKKAARQAVEETTVESAPETVAPDEVTTNPVASETQKEVEIVQTSENTVAVVEVSGEVYGGTDPNQISQSDYLQMLAEGRAAEAEAARRQSTVVTAPNGNTYNAPSQAVQQESDYYNSPQDRAKQGSGPATQPLGKQPTRQIGKGSGPR